ncbi:MAG: leucine-rich repeat domain-containing protein [Desulfobacterales bacterium]|nr:leucine-rich repeat domain-containing protein [Desulfobacterales bacterium]
MTHLRTLDIGGHHISKIPPEIGNLKQLRKLDISNNQITALPPEIGQIVRWLKELQINRNRFTTLPPEIGLLTRLTLLDVGLCPNLTSLPQRLETCVSCKSWNLIIQN